MATQVVQTTNSLKLTAHNLRLFFIKVNVHEYEFAAFALLLLDVAAAVEDAVEYGDNNEGDEGGDREAADDDEAHGGPDFGALGGGGGHGDHAEDGGEGGHEHGAQTALSGEGDGLVEGDAAFAHEVDVVDEHDTVLDDDTDEEDESEEAHHVDVVAGEEHHEHHAADGEGDGEHDDEGLGEGFELRGHDDVDEHEDKHAEHHHVACGILLVLVVAGEGDVDVGGYLHLVELMLHALCQLLQRGVVGHDGEGEVALAVLALDGGRAPVLLDFGQFLELDDFARGCGDGELLDVGDGGAVLLAEADHDVVLLAVLLEESGGHAVDAVADVEGHGGAVEAVEGQFLLVEGDLELGAVLVAADLGVAGAGDVLFDALLELLGEVGVMSKS